MKGLCSDKFGRPIAACVDAGTVSFLSRTACFVESDVGCSSNGPLVPSGSGSYIASAVPFNVFHTIRRTVDTINIIAPSKIRTTLCHLRNEFLRTIKHLPSPCSPLFTLIVRANLNRPARSRKQTTNNEIHLIHLCDLPFHPITTLFLGRSILLQEMPYCLIPMSKQREVIKPQR